MEVKQKLKSPLTCERSTRLVVVFCSALNLLEEEDSLMRAGDHICLCILWTNIDKLLSDYADLLNRVVVPSSNDYIYKTLPQVRLKELCERGGRMIFGDRGSETLP